MSLSGQNVKILERFYDVCLLCWSGSCEGLQKFHDKGEKLTKNALKKLDGILLPEFYKKVAEGMQEEKTTLQSLPNSIDDIILDQWVSMHLDHPQNGQYVRTEKGVYHRRDVGSASALVRRTFSISVLWPKTCGPAKRLLHLEGLP